MGDPSSGEYSPDGSELAIGSHSGGVFIYSLPDYEFQRKFLLNDHRIWFLDWSFDGTRIAVASDEVLFVLNSTSGGKLLNKNIGGRIQSLKWSPVDDILAVKRNKEVMILDAITGETMRAIPDIRDMSWNPNGEEIACSTESGITIMNPFSGEVLNTIAIDPPSGNLRYHDFADIKWSGDGSNIAFYHSWYDEDSKTATAQFIVMEASSESILGTLNVTTTTTIDFQWSPDGTRIVFVYYQGNLTLYDPKLQDLGSAQGAFYGIESMSWSNSKDDVCIITSSRIRVVDTDSLEYSYIPEYYIWGVNGVSWSPYGDRIALCDDVYDMNKKEREGRIRILDSRTGFELKKYHASTYIRSVDWNPNEDSIAYCISNQTIIINAENGEVLSIFNHSRGELVLEVLWSPSGKMVASRTYYDYSTWIWNVENKEHVLTLNHTGHISSITWSPDGTQIATSSNGMIKLWNASSGDLLRTLFINITGPRIDDIYDIDWSPDGDLIACSYRNHWFGILNISTGELIESFNQLELAQTGGWSSATVLKWSPDGRKLAAMGNVIFIRDSDREEFKFLDNPSHISGSISTFDWSPDGLRIVMGHHDGVTTMWGSPADVQISSDINFSKNNPYRDEKIQIQFSIKNTGGLDANNISLRVYDNLTLLDEQIIEILEKDGGTNQVQINFTPHRREHRIRIALDEEDLIPEFNNTNNFANKTLVALQPTDYGHLLMVILGIIGSIIFSMLLVLIVNKKRKKD
jgi:WD40 repeat protein